MSETLLSTNDEQHKINTMQAGFDLLCSYARMISNLPLEEWLEAFEKAEAGAPIIDPTLYRKYIYSGKGEVIKDLILAALVVKREFANVRQKVLDGKVK